MAKSQHLRRKLNDALGQEAAEDFVDWMNRTDESLDGLRGDVAELRHEMRREFALVREEMRTIFAQTDARMEKRFGDLLKWSFVFWSGAVLAIAALAGVLRQ